MLFRSGVVVKGDRVVAAGCVFPLTQREGLGSHIGMRHRAAIGLTEDTDAVVVVVSEETREISVAQRGHLVQGLDTAGLRAFLATTLMTPTRPGNWLVEALRKVIGTVMIPRTAEEAEATEGFQETVEPTPAAPGGQASESAASPAAKTETSS